MHYTCDKTQQNLQINMKQHQPTTTAVVVAVLVAVVSPSSTLVTVLLNHIDSSSSSSSRNNRPSRHECSSDHEYIYVHAEHYCDGLYSPYFSVYFFL